MRHRRDAELGEPLGQLDGVRATLQLDGVGVGLLQHASGVLDARVGAHADGEKRHVGDDERVVGPACDGGGVARHLVDRHRKRRVVAELRVPDRITDEDHVDPGLVHDGRGRGVVRGQHGDRLRARLRSDVLRTHTGSPVAPAIKLPSQTAFSPLTVTLACEATRPARRRSRNGRE